METIQDSLPDKSVASEPLVGVAGGPLPSRMTLPAKGSCWYCEKPLDSVRRFCGKTCASAFDEEAEFTR